MLDKRAIDVAFAQGLDTKTDKKRVAMGKFVRLVNTVFDKGGELQKRNGYGALPALPDSSYAYMTTFNGSLTAAGPTIAAYNAATPSWVSKGTMTPLSLRTLPLLRNNLNQTAADAAVAANGLVCLVYLETNGSTTTNKFVIANSVTGQNITAPRAIPVASGTVSGGMRVFTLGNSFVIVFTNTITGTAHLQYVAIPVSNPTAVGANTDIAAAYVTAATLSWDGCVVGSKLFLAYNTTTGGQAIKVTYLDSAFTLASAVTFASRVATAVSVTADLASPGSPIIWVSAYDTSSTDAYALAVDQNLNTLKAPLRIATGGTFSNITAAVYNATLVTFFEVPNSYSAWGTAAVPTNRIISVSININTVSAPSSVAVVRSVGLASKAFTYGSSIYFLAAFQSPYQPSYFLIDGLNSTQAAPRVVARLAYQNGGGYLPTGLPGVTLAGGVASVAFLQKDLVQAVNKNTAVPAGSQTAGVYSQTGVELVTLTFGSDGLFSAEIGGDLHFTGGLLWMYDGYLPVEHNFLLYPDTNLAHPSDFAAWSASGGSMAAKPDTSTNTNAYYYQVTYEWTDNQGNAFRSAPSIPVAVTTTGAGTSGSVTLNIPTLRLTYKIANPVKIVIYRWSVAQQVYYQTTSISAPLLNDTTVDTVQFVDTNADATILGNNVLYTTGGVLEDLAAPASDILTIFDTRLWLVDAEDRNLLWFSKPVIEATPVEMSDLLTTYIPPTVGTATGEITSLFPLDDKLIISKGGNSLIYINGSGPDITGVNSQYSQPIFITSTVGCNNQRSQVVIPSGLMFQSDKGLWLLGRDLQTSYIGAAVEDLTSGAVVTSAVAVPETNQVRFTLDSGITLMYDYYYDQWGSFNNVAAVSSCIYQDLHTYLSMSGRAAQEQVGVYLDGGTPVLVGFTTGPLRLGDLQNYQRLYFVYLLGTYFSPHKLFVQIAYDYSATPAQGIVITPVNASPPYGAGGAQDPYGEGTPYGGPGSLEQWRLFPKRQRCQAFSLIVDEIFDATVGQAAGAGLTLSGINVVIGGKKGYHPQPAKTSAG